MNSPNEPTAPSAARLAHPAQREQELLRPYSVPTPPLLRVRTAGGASASRNAFQVGWAVFQCGLITFTETFTGNCFF